MIGIVVSLLAIYIGAQADFFSDFDRLRYLLATRQVEAIAKAVGQYRADCGEYPSVDSGLDALVLDPGANGWRGPYLKKVPLDPWRRPYIYSHSGDSATPDILSYGSDGKPGGKLFDADISSRRPPHSIPDSPGEVQVRLLWLGVWIGAWMCLFGSLVVLAKTSRSRRG